MKHSSALIFGYNEYGLEIAKNVAHKYNDIVLYSLNDAHEDFEEEISFRVEKFDLSDHWDELEMRSNLETSLIFCALNDEANNIFLTLSLRSAFKDVTIIALAKNKEDSNKLRMAGASKVIPILETTADIITDMLKKPIVTKVLHSILYENSDLKIKQIAITNTEYFYDRFPGDIEWSKEHKVIILSVIHADMSSEFVYSTKAKHHKIKNGDIFVTVGYEEDLKAFEKLLGGKE